MCQLFAMNSNRPMTVQAALRTFTARGGRTGEHVDGWGMAFHDGEGCRLFIDPQRAADSALADFLCLYPIQATTVLAHVRKATHGIPAPVNCHPFQREWRGRIWSFCHNGKLLDFAPALSGDYVPVGQTDSEYAFCWLMEQLRRQLKAQAEPHWQDIATLLAELASQIGRHGEFNLTFTDGQALYTLCATRLTWTQHTQHHGRDTPRMVQIATEPLGGAHPWHSFVPGEMKVFVRGEEVWSHQIHSQPITPRAVHALAA
ncbi:MAG: class II glutamine amidotransferase [Leptothrix ochracea]|uniref:class II glutamine amidotransferase n=1 Tax=Leptothrix ochracea TaxID=735331 RepID=UPI0034E2DE4C